METPFDCVVVGGGPCGATAADDMARAGHRVLLLDKAGRIKPCGGAIPPRAIDMFEIDQDQLVARIKCARMVSPKGRHVDIPINGGYVGMVDRERFDEYLRERASTNGATRLIGTYVGIEREGDATYVLYRPKDAGHEGGAMRIPTRFVIGADGARSNVARQEIPGGTEIPYVIAYHEIVRSPEKMSPEGFEPDRCDVYYDGRISPDFYGWVFPHGDQTSVGMGTEINGFSLKKATADLRDVAGLGQAETIRREGAPIPLKPLDKWDNGRDVVLAGDAAGVVAPSSGEGIFYAMYAGRCAGEAVVEALAATTERARAKALAKARKGFIRQHGGVFWILRKMQDYWYTSDNRRERFVAICRDKDVQELTFDAYMNKELVKAKPLAHVRIFFKNVAHLMGIVPA